MVKEYRKGDGLPGNSVMIFGEVDERAVQEDGDIKLKISRYHDINFLQFLILSTILFS